MKKSCLSTCPLLPGQPGRAAKSEFAGCHSEDLCQRPVQNRVGIKYPGEEKALGKVSRVVYATQYVEDGDQQFPSSLKLNEKEVGLSYNMREMVMTVGPQISK